MDLQRFERTVKLPVSGAQAFAWHERPGALERLSPPWERIELESSTGGVRDGAEVRLRAKVGPFWLRWVVEHRDYVAGRNFRDVARSGPFTHWDHRHEFSDTGNGSCELRDRIEYALPGGALGAAFGGGFTQSKLSAMFSYRHATTRADLDGALARARAEYPETPAPRILVSGGSGLIGRALVPFLTTQGCTVRRLVRRAPVVPDEVQWDPVTGAFDQAAAGPIDAVVHLAGAGIADARWTAARRRELFDSRVLSTRGLAKVLASLPQAPRVVIGGSATGFYGDAGDIWCDERSPAGRSFLAELTKAWEAEWAPLAARGVRVVNLRTGIVLSPAGGALAKLVTPFSLGLGGPVGSGKQWWSWISIDDLVGAIGHALVDTRVSGPLNAVGPETVTNREFTRVLARVLRRPAVLPAPAWALRAALGRGMADEALLSGQRVRPGALIASGYQFRHENLETALRHVLGCI